MAQDTKQLELRFQSENNSNQSQIKQLKNMNENYKQDIERLHKLMAERKQDFDKLQKDVLPLLFKKI